MWVSISDWNVEEILWSVGILPFITLLFVNMNRELWLTYSQTLYKICVLLTHLHTSRSVQSAFARLARLRIRAHHRRYAHNNSYHMHQTNVPLAQCDTNLLFDLSTRLINVLCRVMQKSGSNSCRSCNSSSSILGVVIWTDTDLRLDVLLWPSVVLKDCKRNKNRLH